MQRCPAPPSDLLNPSKELETTGGDPDKAPEVFRHNGEIQHNDRLRVYRWQKWWEACNEKIN